MIRSDGEGCDQHEGCEELGEEERTGRLEMNSAFVKVASAFEPHQ